MAKVLYVTKNTGAQEKFDESKLKKTLLRSGANEDIADKIVNEVLEKAYNGIPTKEILKMAIKILDREEPVAAIKYDLKGSIMRLGPAGFFFENFVAEVLRNNDYRAKVHTILKGACVSHEIDIIASKETPVMKELLRPSTKYFMIECKFHNAPGIFTGIKDILYTYARFEDLVDGWKEGKCQKFDQPWLATNTKFSTDAVQYANCKNMMLLGWNHPLGNSLEDLIERKKLYPVTALRNIDDDTLQKLSLSGMMLCKDLFKDKPKKIASITGISLRKINILIQDAEKVLE